MIKNARIMVAFAVAFFMCQAQPSFAQVAVEPPASTGSMGYFPKLPYSSPCKKEAVLGTWKLLGLYEAPAGIELVEYGRNPLQFYVFDNDNLYGAWAGPLRDLSASDVKAMTIGQNKSLQQYVINKFGMVFFYKDGIPIDSLACFIVAQGSGPFGAGQMLIMPPERSAKGRLVKVYQRVWSEPETLATQPAVPPTQ